MLCLEFENVSLDDLPSRIDNFLLKAFLGFTELEFLQPFRVRVSRRHNSPKPWRRVRCIYALAYASGTFKIGSSSYEFVVSRMFSQGPLAGTIVSSVLLPEGMDLQQLSRELEERVAKALCNQGFKATTRKSMELLSSHLRSLVEVGAFETRDLVYKLELIAEHGWLHLHDLSARMGFEVISAPGTFTFTPKFTDEDRDMLAKVLSTGATEYGFSKVKPKGEYELIVLHNATCLLKSVSRGELHIGACDRLAFNFEFELLW